jgi:DNA-binding MarR family transcriptional regulator
MSTVVMRNGYAGAMTTTPEQSVRWLDDVEMRAWRTFIETVNDVTDLLEADLERGKGLSIGDYQVLVFLSEASDRRMRMSDLAAKLHLSPSGLTRRLDGLVRSGLVSRQPSAEDRRVLLAVLTDAGFERIVDAAPVHVASVRRRLLDALTHEQTRHLGEILEAVRLHLEADCPPGGCVKD